jgi:hypothetical protein
MTRARVNHLFSHLDVRGFSHLFSLAFFSTFDLVLGSIIYHDTHPREEDVPALRCLRCLALNGTCLYLCILFRLPVESQSESKSEDAGERRVKEGVIIGPLMNVGSFTDLPSSNRSRQLSTLELRFSLSRLLLFGSPRRSILPSHLTMLSQRLPPSHYAFLYYFSIIGDRP